MVAIFIQVGVTGGLELKMEFDHKVEFLIRRSLFDPEDTLCFMMSRNAHNLIHWLKVFH